MASTNLSGAKEIVIDKAGSGFSSGSEQIIPGKYVHGDTAFEADDPNTPESPKGGQLFGGQLGTVIVQTSDMDVKAQLETWRTGNTDVDVRFKLPDGAGGTENKDYLGCEWQDLQEEPTFDEHGSVNTLMALLRAYDDAGILG
jgi:hypothetical protein